MLKSGTKHVLDALVLKMFSVMPFWGFVHDLFFFLMLSVNTLSCEIWHICRWSYKMSTCSLINNDTNIQAYSTAFLVWALPHCFTLSPRNNHSLDFLLIIPLLLSMVWRTCVRFETIACLSRKLLISCLSSQLTLRRAIVWILVSGLFLASSMALST